MNFLNIFSVNSEPLSLLIYSGIPLVKNNSEIVSKTCFELIVLSTLIANDCLLIIGAFVCLTVYLILKHAPYYTYAFWLLLPLFLKDLIAIKKTKPELLDPFLGQQVKHSFLLVLVYGVLLVV